MESWQMFGFLSFIKGDKDQREGPWRELRGEKDKKILRKGVRRRGKKEKSRNRAPFGEALFRKGKNREKHR